MSEEITASIIINSKTFSRGVYWSMRRTAWKKWFGRILMCLTVSSFFLLFWVPRKSNERLPTVVFFGACLGALFGRSWEANKCKRSIDEGPTANQQAIFKFSENGFSVKLKTSDSRADWTSLQDTYSTPDGCLLYPQRNIFFWLPKTAFTSEADYNRFLDLLVANTKHSKLS